MQKNRQRKKGKLANGGLATLKTLFLCCVSFKNIYFKA